MTAVLVHGVPVTSAVWQRLGRCLAGTDVVPVRLPGFGGELPPGFEPTMDGYAAWLATSISHLDEVDLVGQDWGGLLVLRVASAAPSNVRSWVVDSPDLDAGFAWHPGAIRWQTPGQGEQLARWIGGSPLDRRVELLATAGVPLDVAVSLAPAIDDAMTTAMLGLYRSATDIGTAWGPDLDRITAPGVCVVAGRDPFREPERVRRLADRLAARLLELPGAGHFWMLDEPEAVGRALTGFWGPLGR